MPKADYRFDLMSKNMGNVESRSKVMNERYNDKFVEKYYFREIQWPDAKLIQKDEHLIRNTRVKYK